jgi:hypothetical protein
MLGGAGALTICDLGQARIGKVHRSKAMPTPYRALEVILGMTWGNSVDVWSVGLLVRGFCLMLILAKLTPITGLGPSSARRHFPRL